MSKPVVACEFCEKPAKQRGMCNSHYQRVWRIENEDKYLARCRDKVLSRTQYRKHHKAKLALAAKYRKDLDPVAQAAYMRDYYTANADIIKVRSRIWRADNPEQRNELGRAHRARRRGAPINDLTVAQWLEIKDAFGACCAYCGDMCDALTQDHIVPLSQGGSHTASNIAPACHSCNCKKHTSSAEEFLARLDAEGNSALHKLG